MMTHAIYEKTFSYVFAFMLLPNAMRAGKGSALS